MPKNNVADLITDQEMAFVRLVVLFPDRGAVANRFTPSQAPEPYVSKTTGLPTAAEL